MVHLFDLNIPFSLLQVQYGFDIPLIPSAPTFLGICVVCIVVFGLFVCLFFDQFRILVFSYLIQNKMSHAQMTIFLHKHAELHTFSTALSQTRSRGTIKLNTAVFK